MTETRKKPDDVAPATAREALSANLIAREALALIDERGLDGCSMRVLGTRLGVKGMAIYYYFKNKGQLLDAVLDLLVGELSLSQEGPPRARLREIMRSYRAIAIAHPGAFVLLPTRRFNTEYAFRFYERVLGTFAELGLPPADCALWFRLIGGYAVSAGLAEIASRELVPDATSLLLEHAISDIPFANIRAAAVHLRVENLEQVFEESLDILFKALDDHVAALQGAVAGA